MAIKVNIHHNPATMSTDIYIIDEKDNSIRIAQPANFVFEPVTPGTVKPPTFSISDPMAAREFLTGLSQALIESGYRDKSVSKDGEIKRLNNHLEDMRKISFQFIDGLTKE